MGIKSWSRYRIIVFWCLSIIAVVMFWSLGSALYDQSPLTGWWVAILSAWLFLPPLVVNWTWLSAQEQEGSRHPAKAGLLMFATSVFVFWIALVAKSIGQVVSKSPI